MMKVKFTYIRQTPMYYVYIAHFPGFERGTTFPVPKAAVRVTAPREFNVEFNPFNTPSSGTELASKNTRRNHNESNSNPILGETD